MTGETLHIEINPQLPPELGRLHELAGNLRFTWHRPTRALFSALDPRLWLAVRSNPRLFLRSVAQSKLDRAVSDAEWLAAYHAELEGLDRYLAGPHAGPSLEGLLDAGPVAYFCAEFGFHESLPMYSGGLGVLAGDHCKAASDAGLSFVAVGLLYRRGYFTQQIDAEGGQHALNRDIDRDDLPVEPVRDATGAALVIGVPVADRTVRVRVWRASVGRVPVYLLDSDVEENSAADREITHALYAGDHELRIQQELLLGVGGRRTLKALGIEPSVYHLNEGHAAFLCVELAAELVERGLGFEAALEAVAARCVFTTHTPVAAGHDAFDQARVLHYLQDAVRRLGVPAGDFLKLGNGSNGHFNMTRLAIAGTRHQNGVSRLHGQVSALICADNWPELPVEDSPIGYVTNGVHVPTFLFQYWQDLFDRALGSAWRERLGDPEFWTAVRRIPDGEFLAAKRQVKAVLLRTVRARLLKQCRRNGLSDIHFARMVRWLDPDEPAPLVVGFARRFATYKRAALLLRDRAWLSEIACDRERPVVFVFAGKAHPQDLPGQQMIREVCEAAASRELTGHVVFVEDYDLGLARALVAGADVWLNTPVSPLEASGTSGIKAAINGTLNLSVLDGWWAEGCDGENGWGIAPSTFHDDARRDDEDARSIYELLQDEVVPLYYERDGDGLPRRWAARMKRSMETIIPSFGMGRVVADYAQCLYAPAARAAAARAAGGHQGARDVAGFKRRAAEAWPGVSLRLLERPPRRVASGESLRLRVAATLGSLKPAEVRVELLVGRELPDGERQPPPLSSFRAAAGDVRIRGGVETAFIVLNCAGERLEDGAWVYTADIAPGWCGRLAGHIRAVPQHPLFVQPYEMGLVRWL